MEDSCVLNSLFLVFLLAQKKIDETRWKYLKGHPLKLKMRTECCFLLLQEQYKIISFHSITRHVGQPFWEHWIDSCCMDLISCYHPFIGWTLSSMISGPLKFMNFNSSNKYAMKWQQSILLWIKDTDYPSSSGLILELLSFWDILLFIK